MFRLTVMPVEKGIMVSADRQVLAAVVGNLLVLIEIEDECSVLPSAAGVQKRMMVYAGIFLTRMRLHC